MQIKYQLTILLKDIEKIFSFCIFCISLLKIDMKKLVLIHKKLIYDYN